MASQTIQAFYLGVFSDLDPKEKNFEAENSASLQGMTFGGPGNSLHTSIDSLTLTDTDNDGVVRENDDGQIGEPVTYGGVSSTLDSAIEYNVTLTYDDGTTATTRMIVLQDVSGRVFLAPSASGSGHNDVLDDKPISSISLDTVQDDNLRSVSGNLEEKAFADDVVDGTSGDDVIGTGYTDADGTQMNPHGGADTVDAGAGNDSVDGGRGDDVVLGGEGNDTIDGGSGDDSIDGGAGNDSLSGGDAVTGDGARLGFKWGDIPDPDNGGIIDDRDDIGSGTQTVGGVDVTYTVTPGIGRFENENQYVDGIDDGADTIDGNSALDIHDTGSVDIAFSQGVENVAFRVNNFDAINEHLVIRAYDENGNQIAFNTTPGTNVTGSDTDGVPGADTFHGAGGEFHDIDPEGSLLVQIPGPVARIEMDFTSIDQWTLTFTDIYFDDPASVAQAGGDDTLSGGAGDDVIDGGDGNDSLSGGEGSDSVRGDSGDDTLSGGTGNDTLDGGAGNDALHGGDGSDTFLFGDGGGVDSVWGGEGGTDFDTLDLSGLSGPVSVTSDNSNYGTATNGTDTAYFADIEHFILTEEADFADGRNATDGVSIELRGGNDTAYGTHGDDSISGGEGDDFIDSWAGNDTIDGGAGNDTVLGGSDDDLVMGGAGNDVLQGWTGNDTLQGGAGNDTLQTWQGDERLEGGDDADTFLVTDGTGNDTIIGGEGGTDDDVIDLSDLSGPVTVTYTGDGAGTITTTHPAHGTGTITFSEIERFILTEQSDVVDGTKDGVGIDLEAGGGDDLVLGGSAGDRLVGGAGEDGLYGNGGNDTLLGGAGNDELAGDEGDDSLVGGDGEDYLGGGDGDDTISGDAGDDVIEGEAGYDLITGGDGHDWISGGSGDDTIDAGAGNDTVYGDFGDDMILGGDGEDFLSGGAGYDELFGGAGHDTLDGGLSDDYIEGGAGNDHLLGGDGADWLSGGTGHDTLTGGGGNDTFHYAPGDGHDTITDFNTGNTGTLDDGNDFNNDSIDLSGYYDHLSELWADQADDGILNQSNTTDLKGRATDYSDNTQFGSGSLTVAKASADKSSFTTENTGVVCFTSGTAIRTPGGDVLIDDLRIGDLVQTMDNGPQRICWISKRTFGQADLLGSVESRPVLVRTGVLGAERDLLVSQQHGVLVTRHGDRLVRAKHLVGTVKGTRICNGKRSVTYIHLMFETHQIIFAENVPAESFYPGPMALGAVPNAGLADLRGLFPDVIRAAPIREAIATAYGDTARPFLRGRELPFLSVGNARGRQNGSTGAWR